MNVFEFLSLQAYYQQSNKVVKLVKHPDEVPESQHLDEVPESRKEFPYVE